MKGRDAFKLLEPLQQEKFKANCKEGMLEVMMNESYRNFASFVRSGFDWDSSTEGIKYWQDIAYM